MRKFAVLIQTVKINPIASKAFESKIDQGNFGEYVNGKLHREPLPEELSTIAWGVTEAEADKKLREIADSWAAKYGFEIVYG